MVRKIAPRSLALSDLRKKVNKNSRILNSRETKRIRQAFADTTPTTTATVQNVSALISGAGAAGRNGDKVHAKSISFQGSYLKNGASVSTLMRFMIFRDNEGTTTAPTLAEIFDSESDFFDNHQRSVGIQPMKRFTVIWDKMIVMNESFDGQATAGTWKMKKRLNFNILYSGAASTDEGKNSLWLMTISDEATNVPSVVGDIVFEYTDL